MEVEARKVLGPGADGAAAALAAAMPDPDQVPEVSSRVYVDSRVSICLHLLQSLIPHLFSLFCLISPSTRSVSLKSFPFGFSICMCCLVVLGAAQVPLASFAAPTAGAASAAAAANAVEGAAAWANFRGTGAASGAAASSSAAAGYNPWQPMLRGAIAASGVPASPIPGPPPGAPPRPLMLPANARETPSVTWQQLPSPGLRGPGGGMSPLHQMLNEGRWDRACAYVTAGYDEREAPGLCVCSLLLRTRGGWSVEAKARVEDLGVEGGAADDDAAAAVAAAVV